MINDIRTCTTKFHIDVIGFTHPLLYLGDMSGCAHYVLYL